MTLAHSLYATVAYFDVLGLPATPLQCVTWRVGEKSATPTMTDVFAALRAIVQSGNLEAHDGFFILKGRRELVRAMHERRALMHRKWNVAWWAAMLFARIPFVEAVFASGSLTQGNVHEASDVDLFIVARRGGLWRARFVTTLIMKLLHRRPGEGSRDPLCLSFYVTRDALDLSPLRADDNDLHFAFWSASMVPLFDRGGVYAAFRDANAHWWSTFFGIERRRGVSPALVYKPRVMRTRLLHALAALFSFVFHPVFFERLLRAVQRRMMPAPLIARASTATTEVVISDTVLKFHLNDRRREIFALWQGRLQKTQLM